MRGVARRPRQRLDDVRGRVEVGLAALEVTGRARPPARARGAAAMTRARSEVACRTGRSATRRGHRRRSGMGGSVGRRRAGMLARGSAPAPASKAPARPAERLGLNRQRRAFRPVPRGTGIALPGGPDRTLDPTSWRSPVSRLPLRDIAGTARQRPRPGERRARRCSRICAHCRRIGIRPWRSTHPSRERLRARLPARAATAWTGATGRWPVDHLPARFVRKFIRPSAFFNGDDRAHPAGEALPVSAGLRTGPVRGPAGAAADRPGRLAFVRLPAAERP